MSETQKERSARLAKLGVKDRVRAWAAHVIRSSDAYETQLDPRIGVPAELTELELLLAELETPREVAP